MLALHDMLHQKAAMQSLLVVILACLDSKHWLQEVSQEAQAIAAVLEVLQNDYGFDDELAEEEAEQGQEAAWAVLAAVSKYMAENDVSDQVCPMLDINPTALYSNTLVSCFLNRSCSTQMQMQMHALSFAACHL